MRRHIPSLKTLHKVFGQQFDHDYGDDAKHKLGQLRLWLEEWRDSAASSREMLGEADALLEGHGVEHLESENKRAEAYYVNMGDTYTPTILLDLHRSKVWATDWGSWVEAEERAGNTFR